MGWVSAIPQISALTVPAHLIVKRLCNCLNAFTLSVGVLADYRKWPLQDPYPPLLGISARMASWYRLWPLPIPGLWHLLEIAPNPLPANLFLFRISLHILSPIPSSTQFPTYFDLQNLFCFPFWERIKHLSLCPPCYLASLDLLIIAWLFCNLWLISIYKWVYTMQAFWGSGLAHWAWYFLVLCICPRNS